MRKAKIKIHSRDSESDEGFEKPCFVDTEDGYKISYKTDDDDTVLYVKGNKAKMTRRGSAMLTMPFERGKDTVCVIGMPQGGFGKMPFHTEAIEVEEDENHIRIRLVYNMIGLPKDLTATITYED